MAMTEQVRPRVFVSYSLADDEGRSLRDMLSGIFEITAPEMLTGSVARRTALRQLLKDIDVAVVVLPSAEDPSRSNVIFEAGAAAGAGVPLVLVGEAASAPGDLADGLVFEADRVEDVIDAVEELTRARRAAHQREISVADRDEISVFGQDLGITTHSARILSSEYVDKWVTRIQHVRTEHSAIRLISELFQHAGARTRSTQLSGAEAIDRPDLVLWHDDLLATFGLPLPVEVLLRSKSWPAIRARLERTLAASGGRTLVAVVIRDGAGSRVWTDGRRTILVCPADQLATALTMRPLAEALGEMLSSAAA